MNRMIFKFFLLLLLVWTLTPGIVRAQSTPPKELRIGWISQFPDEDMKKLQPLADYLEQKLKPEGYTNVRVVITGSIHSMAYLMRRNKVDLLLDSALPTLAVDQITNLDFLLRQWKNGAPEYHSVVFVKKTDPAGRLEDLGGYAVAMVAPYSTSGYFVPRYFMEHHGMKMHRMAREDETIPPHQIGYLFTFDPDANFRWVQAGPKRAGVTHDRYFDLATSLNRDMKILFRSPPLDRHVVSARANLDPVIREKIVGILLKMDQEPQGRKALKALANTLRFDKLPGGREGFEKSLAPFLPYLREELRLN